MMTESAISDRLKDILSSKKYTDIIDSLRPDGSFTINIMADDMIDIYTEAGSRFYDLAMSAILEIIQQKKQLVDAKHTYKNLKINIATDSVVPMHDINARDHENCVIEFDCDVIAADTPMTYIKSCVMACPKCYKETDVKCNSHDKKLPTIHCDNFSCKKTLLEVQRNGALVTDNLQHILVQEFMEDSLNSSPIIFQSLLTGNLVGDIFIGQKKRITGTFRSVFNTKTNENTILIDVISSGDLDNTREVTLSDSEVAVIKNMSTTPNFFTTICSSFAPQIYGYEDIKKSILLQLAGGVGGLKRGDINVLLVGDPSMAKSELLKFAHKVTQKSIYTSGKGSTAAGLTIGLVKLDTGKHIAQAGVLPLCSGGFAFIDEFDKMNTIDRSGLHEAMEQQTVSIAKAGFRMTLPSKTAILAAANPKFGSYDIDESLATNIDIPPPLLSRFDLIWLIRDKIDAKDDERKASFILDTFVDGIEHSNVLLESNVLLGYLNHIRKLKPVLTKQSQAHILEIYQRMRSIASSEDSSISIGTRQLEAIVRLAIAHAKLHFREEVVSYDVEAIEEIVKRMFESFGFDFSTGRNIHGNTVSSTTKNESKEQKAHRVWNECKSKTGTVRHELFIQRLSKEDSFDETKAHKIFGIWEQQCIIKLNKDGSYEKV